MNNIEDLEDIGQRIKSLFMLTEMNNVIDYRAHYKWEIGSHIYSTIMPHIISGNPFSDPVEVPNIYGYPFEINRKDPNVIKLWKEVQL